MPSPGDFNDFLAVPHGIYLIDQIAYTLPRSFGDIIWVQAYIFNNLEIEPARPGGGIVSRLPGAPTRLRRGESCQGLIRRDILFRRILTMRPGQMFRQADHQGRSGVQKRERAPAFHRFPHKVEQHLPAALIIKTLDKFIPRGEFIPQLPDSRRLRVVVEPHRQVPVAVIDHIAGHRHRVPVDIPNRTACPLTIGGIFPFKHVKSSFKVKFYNTPILYPYIERHFG
jgi:hypothetical protein